MLFGLKSKRDYIVKEDIEWQPTEMKSRGIKIGKHEKCEFSHDKVVYEDKQLKMLGIDKPQGKNVKGDKDESDSDD